MEEKCFDERTLSTWEEFLKEVDEIAAQLPEIKERLRTYPPRILFRGQEDAAWSLTTTLERRIKLRLDLIEYLRLARSSKGIIETITSTKWEMPSLDELKEWIQDAKVITSTIPAYEYLVYLRHLGFPSPLLDWTRSAHIAAFFAFFKAKKETERVSIFCYVLNAAGTHGYSEDLPYIFWPGEYITTHRRHFLQQSQYSFCCQFNKENIFFEPHESAIKRNVPKNNRIIKFTLPTTERMKVLKLLDSVNINAYSLFETEEALLETVAIREIDFSERFK